MEDAKTSTCPTCGVKFCMPTGLHKKLRETGQTFYCPNGHSIVFQPSENARLRQQIEWLTHQRDMYKRWYDDKKRQLEAAEGTIQAYRMNLGKAKKRLRLAEDKNRVEA